MRDRPVAFDVTRLITRLRHASPTGIDRVDLAYGRHLLRGGGERFGLVTTPFGPRILEREAALAIVEAAAIGWTEHLGSDDDSVYRRIVDAAPKPAPSRTAAPPASAVTRRKARAQATLQQLRGSPVDRLPRGTLYLHTSHLRLDLPERFTWLYDRDDIQAAFFVHDLIPISHPEYGRKGEAEKHGLRMQTVARHAARVFVNSAEVGERFAAHCRAQGWRSPPTSVAPLGVEPVFSRRDEPPAGLSRPTFVVCGTIEPRKNHILLLHLWRALAERLGAQTPRLVVVGRRGWLSNNVSDLLERCPAVKEHVTEAAGLSSAGLARLMRGATALLMPSFIEGYGLPVIEAAASGLPVVASDIPAHREIAGGFAHFLDPLDGPGWMAAVEELSRPGSSLRAALASRLAEVRLPSWDQHFQMVEAALDDPPD